MKKRGRPSLAESAIVLLRLLRITHAALFELPGVVDPMRREWITVRRREAELHSLERRRYIQFREKGEHLYKVMLTQKGIFALLKAKVIRQEKLLPHGQILVIIFDIPEAHRRARQMLRRFLKESKFHRLQKSVWMTRRDVRRPLLWLLRIIQVMDWVHLITATKIDGRLRTIEN